MGKRCVSCGHEAVRASLVEHEHGEMRVRIGGTKYADDKRHLWEQAVSYARGYSALRISSRDEHPYLPTDYRRMARSVMDGCHNARRADHSRGTQTKSDRAISHTRKRGHNEMTQIESAISFIPAIGENCG